jgi:hypothetical protein
MPTSGPFHRLDLACQGATDPEWPAAVRRPAPRQLPRLREQELPAGQWSARADGPLIRRRPPLQRSRARATWSCSPNAAPPSAPTSPGFGSLPIHFMIGKDDAGAYEPLATALHDALAGDRCRRRHRLHHRRPARDGQRHRPAATPSATCPPRPLRAPALTPSRPAQRITGASGRPSSSRKNRSHAGKTRLYAASLRR